MTVRERLLQEFECAIDACLGDYGKEEEEDYKIEKGEILQIAQKVLFYLDLI